MSLSFVGDVEYLSNRKGTLSCLFELVDSLFAEAQGAPLRKSAYIKSSESLFANMWKVDPQEFILSLATAIKESIPKLEMYLLGISKIPLQTYPTEQLEESLCLLEVIAATFVDAKGQNLKESCSSCLEELLVPLIPILTTEVNIPRWERIISKLVYRRALELSEKSKYRPVLIYLTSTALCLSPKGLFASKWLPLAESIAISIRDNILTPRELLPLMRLLWVYTHRNPEAFASQTQKITKVVSILSPPAGKKLNLTIDAMQLLYFGLADCLAERQRVIYLRDFVTPLLEEGPSCSITSTIIENFPVARALIGVRSFLFFIASKSVFPTLGRLSSYGKVTVSSIIEDLPDFEPDISVQDSFYRATRCIVKMFLHLAQLLWQCFMDGKEDEVRELSSQVKGSLHCLRLLLDVIPALSVPNEDFVPVLEMLIRLITFRDEASSNKALAALGRTLEKNTNRQSSIRVYWYLSGLFDDIPDFQAKRKGCLSNAFPIVISDLVKNNIVTSLEGSNQGCNNETLAVIADCSTLALLNSLHVDETIRNAALIVQGRLSAALMERRPDWNGITLVSEQPKLVNVLQMATADGTEVPRVTMADFFLPLIQECPSIVELAKGTIIDRLQRLQAHLITCAGNSESVIEKVKIWSRFASAALAFGPPSYRQSNPPSKGQGLTGGKLGWLFSLSSKKSSETISTSTELLDYVLGTISISGVPFGKYLPIAISCTNPDYIPEIISYLKPLIGSVSDDYRNTKYQVGSRPSKQDLLKVDIARILAAIVPILNHRPIYQDPSHLAHATVQKYIIETFYFCSEIDVEEKLIGLRTSLAELVTEYHEATQSLHPHYEYFPFKLQSELFVTFAKWFDAAFNHKKIFHSSSVDRASEYLVGKDALSQARILSVGRNDGSRILNSHPPYISMADSELTISSGNQLSWGSHVSTASRGSAAQSEATQHIISSEVSHSWNPTLDIYACCLVSLCKCLLSPLPQYRTESIPTSQVMRWIDSLPDDDPQAMLYAQEAAFNLLSGNKTLAERIISKCLQPEILLNRARLSRSYFIALIKCHQLSLIEVPVTTMATVLIATVIASDKQREYFEDIELKQAIEATLAAIISSPQWPPTVLKYNRKGEMSVDLSTFIRSLSFKSSELLPELISRLYPLSKDVYFSCQIHKVVNYLINVLILPPAEVGISVAAFNDSLSHLSSHGALEAISFLSLYSHSIHGQNSCKVDYEFWETLLKTWKHHSLVFVLFWLSFTASYAYRSLFEHSKNLMAHLISRPEFSSLVIESIIDLFEPSQLFISRIGNAVRRASTSSNLLAPANSLTLIKNGIDTLFSGDTILYEDERTTAYIFVEWLTTSYSTSHLPLYSFFEIRHFFKVHQIPFGIPCDNANERLEQLNIEYLYTALDWALKCSDKDYSLKSWHLFTEILTDLSVDRFNLSEFENVVKAIHGYVSMILQRISNNKSSNSLSELLHAAFTAILAFKLEYFEDENLTDGTVSCLLDVISIVIKGSSDHNVLDRSLELLIRLSEACLLSQEYFCMLAPCLIGFYSLPELHQSIAKFSLSFLYHIYDLSEIEEIIHPTLTALTVLTVSDLLLGNYNNEKMKLLESTLTIQSAAAAGVTTQFATATAVDSPSESIKILRAVIKDLKSPSLASDVPKRKKMIDNLANALTSRELIQLPGLTSILLSSLTNLALAMKHENNFHDSVPMFTLSWTARISERHLQLQSNDGGVADMQSKPMVDDVEKLINSMASIAGLLIGEDKSLELVTNGIRALRLLNKRISEESPPSLKQKIIELGPVDVCALMTNNLDASTSRVVQR